MLALCMSLIEEEKEKSKFELLYYKYRRLMKYIAFDILHDDMLAEESVQESFIKIANNIKKIDEVDCHKTKSFIVIIVKNTSLDILKKEKKQAVINTSVPEYTENAMGVQDIVSAIKSLPDIYRDILELKAFHELSDKEIADVLGLSHSTVRKRLERARNALKEILKD